MGTDIQLSISQQLWRRRDSNSRPPQA